ncbi:TetR family transcriptional regulator [Nakamurella silvestris]|nr:TetR family transcriptional regulator [Nakamurella silvestris]
MNLREQKKAETRRTLQQAAHMLARQQPWESVTVDDIASQAGVSRRTFFNYFESKEAVLSSASADTSLGMPELVRARPAEETAWQALRAAFVASLNGATPESITAFRSLWHQLSQMDSVVRVRRELEAGLTAAVHERMPGAPKDDAHLVAAVFLATTRVAITSWLNSEQTVTLVEVIDAAIARVRIS